MRRRRPDDSTRVVDSFAGKLAVVTGGGSGISAPSPCLNSSVIWRILVGEDAKTIDARVRANPEAAYDYEQLFAGLAKPPWQ